MRFAPVTWRKGKKGALRVGYVYFEEYATILLVLVYTKTKKEELTPAEKKTIKHLIMRIEREFQSGPTH